VSWPWSWDETVMGVRYSLTAVLLAAAFVAVVLTFLGE
jgi:hypothetical protein